MRGKSKTLGLLILLQGLFACGGGGGGGAGTVGSDNEISETLYIGVENAAEISETSLREIAIVVGPSLHAALNSKEVSIGVSVNEESAGFTWVIPNSFVRPLLKIDQGSTEDISNLFCESGYASTEINNVSGEGSAHTITTFKNCSLKNAGNIVYDGRVRIFYESIEDQAEPFTAVVEGLTISGGQFQAPVTVNYTLSCSSSTSCFEANTFIHNSLVHQIVNVSIDDSATDSLSGSAILYHSDFGFVRIQFNGIELSAACGLQGRYGVVHLEGDNGTIGQIQYTGDCDFTGSWSNTTGAGNI